MQHTTLLLALLVYFSRFRHINTLLRTLLVLQTGQKKHKHDNGIMCSFDVWSLFTNVPLEETIQICLEKLYSPPDPPTLPRAAQHKVLEFATKKNHFLFTRYME